jgi:hypothetical protein
LAAVMRPTVWALLLAIVGSVLYAVLRGRMRWHALILAGSAITAGAAVFLMWDKGTSSDGGYERSVIYSLTHHLPDVVKVLPEHLKELLSWATADAVFQVRMGAGNVVLSTVLIAAGVGLVRRRVLWGLFFIVTALMIVVILPLDRYYLPVIPLMVFAWWQLVRRINQALPNMAGRLIAGGLLVLGMASNLDKIGGIILEQRRIPFLARYEGGVYQSLLKAADAIHDTADDNSLVLIAEPYGRIMTFLSDRNVVDFRHIGDVDLNGHTIYVVEPADAPMEDVLKGKRMKIGGVIASISTQPGQSAWTLHPAFTAERAPAGSE